MPDYKFEHQDVRLFRNADERQKFRMWLWKTKDYPLRKDISELQDKLKTYLYEYRAQKLLSTSRG